MEAEQQNKSATKAQVKATRLAAELLAAKALLSGTPPNQVFLDLGHDQVVFRSVINRLVRTAEAPEAARLSQVLSISAASLTSGILPSCAPYAARCGKSVECINAWLAPIMADAAHPLHDLHSLQVTATRRQWSGSIRHPLVNAAWEMTRQGRPQDVIAMLDSHPPSSVGKQALLAALYVAISAPKPDAWTRLWGYAISTKCRHPMSVTSITPKSPREAWLLMVASITAHPRDISRKTTRALLTSPPDKADTETAVSEVLWYVHKMDFSHHLIISWLKDNITQPQWNAVWMRCWERSPPDVDSALSRIQYIAPKTPATASLILETAPLAGPAVSSDSFNADLWASLVSWSSKTLLVSSVSSGFKPSAKSKM